METLVDPNDFPAAEKYTYLDAASIALMYSDAARAVINWQRELAENGTLNFDEKAEEAVFEDLHKAAASLFNTNPKDIAVGSSATELMSSLAWAVAPDQETNVVGTDIAHPSTIYPWMRVSRHMNFEVRWARGENGYVRPEDVLQLIDNHTSVVCISHVEYGGGQVYDLSELAEVAHSHGALLVVDATQSAGVIPIDVTSCNVDALVSSAYKWLCGPFGVAILYLAPHLQGDLDPGLVGWRSHKEMWDFQADRLDLPKAARCFEFSTMAYGSAVGLARAIEYLLKVSVERIFEHNKYLADMLIEGLDERNAEIISPKNVNERSSIVAARFPDKKVMEIANHFKQNKIMVSARRDFIRFSPHLYNDDEDIQRALEKLDRVLM